MTYSMDWHRHTQHTPRGGYGGGHLVGGVWVDDGAMHSPTQSTPPPRSASGRNGLTTPRGRNTSSSPGLSVSPRTPAMRPSSVIPASTPYSYSSKTYGTPTPVNPPRLDDLVHKPAPTSARAGSTTPRTTLPYTSMLMAKQQTNAQVFYPSTSADHGTNIQPSPRAGAVRPTAHAAAGPVLLPAQRECHRGKYTVVLDLDETIVYARSYPIKVRPGAQQLLESLKGHAEVVLWTAGDAMYARNALGWADPSGAVEHVISRDPRWYKGDRNEKNLAQLGRDLDKVVIIENTSDCIVRNTDSAILVPDYTGVGELGDVLGKIRGVLHDMFASGQPVASFLADRVASGTLTKVKVPCTVHPVITALSVTGYPPTTSYPMPAAARPVQTPAGYKPRYRY